METVAYFIILPVLSQFYGFAAVPTWWFSDILDLKLGTHE